MLKENSVRALPLRLIGTREIASNEGLFLGGWFPHFIYPECVILFVRVSEHFTFEHMDLLLRCVVVHVLCITLRTDIVI